MSLSFLESFRDKSVFVTGHTGFKGSWLSLWLSRLGARVTGYALEPPTNPSHFHVAGVEEVLLDHHLGDIRDEDKMASAMRAAQPDLVLHLAAQSVVRRSYEIPRETFDVNVMGTICVMEAVRRLESPCSVVAITSDKCYHNKEQIWGYREDDAMGEHDPYGGSKGAAELAIRSYRHSFFPIESFTDHGVKLASARAGNVIGGGDWTQDALIVDIFKSVANNKTIEIRCPGAFRPWQHVIQALSGYLTLAGKLLDSDDLTFCSGFNIGPPAGSELPVQEIVELFLKYWGYGQWEDVSQGHHPHEAHILRLAIDKAIWQLNWKPLWSTQETIRRTVEWYQHYLNEPQSIRDFGFEQIEAYQNSAHAKPDDALELAELNADFR